MITIRRLIRPIDGQLWLARVAMAILLATVALAPLPFGSASPLAMAFWSMALGLALVCAAMAIRERRQTVLLSLVLVVAAAYAFVLHEQLAAHPWLAPFNPLWKQASDALHTAIPPSASIARNEPFFALGSPLLCVLALVVGFLVAADRKRAMLLLKVVAWSGVAYALYGIIAGLVDPNRILWRVRPAYDGSVIATFVNRNTAATYFGSCAVLCFLLLCRRVRQNLPAGPVVWRELIPRMLANMPREVVVRFAMFFICLTALSMTGSRAGMLVSMVALVLAFGVYFHRDLRGWTQAGLAVLGAAAGALVLFGLFGANINARLDNQGLEDEGRIATWRATLKMIQDRPWFGWGQGAFAWAFPAYRTTDVSMSGTWDRAHNTLLEIAADMGIPIAALVVLGWIVIFGILIHGVRKRRGDLIFPAVAISVAALAILHSMVDFSLQIPGYSIVAFALVGAGVARSFAPRGATRKASETVEETAPNQAQLASIMEAR